MSLKQKILWGLGGVLLGYSASRILDQVPIINRIPKIRVS